MKSVRVLMTLSLMLIQLWSLAVQAVTKEMQKLVTYETRANAVAQRSDAKVMLENFEIPLSLIESSVALRAPPQFVQSMIFERNGQKYIRWVINPEDSKWVTEVEKFLVENKISTQRHKYFEGYQTASRSYIAVDPKNGAEFSVKVSTNKTGGHWADKKQTWEDAHQIRMITDYVNENLKKQPALRNIVLLDETMAFGIKALDQGMVIRSYDSLSDSGKTYVPGFSVMHDATGKEIAKLNGSNDPAAFWNENYNKPLGRALAEFFALTGMTYDSPHSQNFLVELDSGMRPTGKIVLRDFGDTYLLQNYFDAIGKSDIPAKWELDNVKKDKINVSVGILHGNNAPGWINVDVDAKSNTSYDQWGRDFHAAFKQELAKQTGVTVDGSPVQRSPGSKYVSRALYFNTIGGMQMMDLAKKNMIRDNLVIRSCERVFAM